MSEILEARERRAARQEALLREAEQGALVCMTMNIAGPRKRSRLIDAAFSEAKRELLAVLRQSGFPPLRCEETRDDAGNELFVLLRAAPETVKALILPLEERGGFGRLLDLDVLRPDGTKLSREELGLPPRACLICGQEGASCARSRRHPLSVLQRKTEEILSAELTARAADRIASLAVRALLFEVGVTPKPGLVDLANSGAHKDMDCFTFFTSAAALQPYFRTCALLGIQKREEAPEAVFAALRLPGKLAEDTMLRATGGVNTHKGAILLIGTLCAAIGRQLALTGSAKPEEVLPLCGEMSRSILSELTPSGEEETVGQRLYRLYGIEGVRGELADGLPSVREIALPRLYEELARGESLNDAAARTVCYLAASVPDTAAIARIGFENWLGLVTVFRQCLEEEPIPPMETVRCYDQSFTNLNFSPGGCADLLAATLLLYFIQKEEDPDGSDGAPN